MNTLQAAVKELRQDLLTRLMRRRPGERVTEITGGVRVIADGSDLLGHKLSLFGEYEFLELAAMIAVSRMVDGIFVDVGANIGYYTVLLAKRFEHVVAIEANPRTHLLLQKNIELNGLTNVDCACVALSNEAGCVSFLQDTTGNIGGSRILIDGKPGGKGDIITMETISGDELLPRFGEGAPIGLIKIDVEGHEERVVAGLQKLIARFRPVVGFEYDLRDGRKPLMAQLLADYRFIQLRAPEPPFAALPSLRKILFRGNPRNYRVQYIDRFVSGYYPMVFAVPEERAQEMNDAIKLAIATAEN